MTLGRIGHLICHVSVHVTKSPPRGHVTKHVISLEPHMTYQGIGHQHGHMINYVSDAQHVH